MSQTSEKVYSEYKSSLEVWKHFLRDKEGLTAKCKLCSKILKTKHHSTKGLHTHLKSIHQIDTKKMVETQASDDAPAPEPAAPKPSASEPVPVAENTLHHPSSSQSVPIK